MKRIKIVGALIFILAITLAVLFKYTSKENLTYNTLIETIKEQKDFTQEISKNIFYIYKNKDSSTKSLDESVKIFLTNMRNKDQALQRSDKIIKLWNDFYLHIQHFRDQIKNTSMYSNIILEESVKDIYNINLKLLIEFEKLIQIEKIHFDQQKSTYQIVLYTLFFILMLLLIYLFTELKSVITFVQKFILTSKAIVTNSTIKDLEPIEIFNVDSEVYQASGNFNTLVKKINNSIEYSSNSIEHSYKSLELVEQNIEDLLNLIYTMSESPRDKELRKKEDTIIQSLEELSSTARRLQNLKNDLDDLTSHVKSK